MTTKKIMSAVTRVVDRMLVVVAIIIVGLWFGEHFGC